VKRLVRIVVDLALRTERGCKRSPGGMEAQIRAKESTVAGRGHFTRSADQSYARTR
jgi:hypothetical protein